MDTFRDIPESVFLMVILMDLNVSAKAGKSVLFLSLFQWGKKVSFLGTLCYLQVKMWQKIIALQHQKLA